MTTIQISKKLKTELDALKSHPRESYAQLIEEMTLRWNETDESQLELSDEAIRSAEQGRKDLKAGRGYTTAQLKKILGL